MLVSAAFAQTAPAGQPETVVVTGSLIARPDYNTATPTVTVTPEALQNSGQIALEQGLTQLPQFSVGTAGSGPFIGGSGQVNLNLRGLGPQRNLVLLDGRRLLPSASDGTVDINQLPQGIIGNMEIITGGASAVYGSDAVSGVVNFKTRKTPDGLDISTAFGSTQTFGGSQFDINAVGGAETNDGKGNIMLAVEYTHRAKVNWGSIPFLTQYQNFPVPLVSGAYAPGSNQPSQAAVNAYFAQFGAPAGNVKNSEALGFNNNGTLFNVGPNPTAPRNVYNLIPQTNAAGQPLEDIFGGSVHHKAWGLYEQNPLDRWSTFAKGDWALTNDIHFFGQALYTTYSSYLQNEPTVTSATQVPTIPVTNPFIPTDLANLLATRPNPTAPFNLNDRFYSFGYRTITNANSIYQFLGGVNGVLGDTMTWEVYASHGQTATNYSSTGAVRFSSIQQLLNDPTGGTDLCAGGYDPFGLHPVSQACEQFASPDITQRTIVTQDVVNADLQGTAFSLPAGDLKFALGGDYRRITFSYAPDAEIQAGDPFTYNPQTPTKGSSPVNEGFGELLVPVVKDLPFAQMVNLDVAYRYSDYSLSGGTNTYKADVDWSVVDSFRLRGGYERAIRAPSVYELFSGNSTYYANISILDTKTTASDPCDVRLPYLGGAHGAQVQALCAAQGLPAAIAPTYTNNDSQIPAISQGNPNLKPEKADTWTGGMVYQPTWDTPWLQNASISIDYYNIRLANAIEQLNMNVVVDNCFNLNGGNPTYSAANYFCSLIRRSPTNGTLSDSFTPYANIGQDKTSGIDLEADWLTDIAEGTGWTDAGTLSVAVQGTYLNNFKQQILPTSPWQEIGGTNITTYPYDTFPTWRSDATFTYHNWGADIGLRWRFIGGLKDQSTITNPASAVPGEHPISYFDLNLGYTLPSTDTRFDLVVSNLFATAPQIVGGQPGLTNAALYSPFGRIYLLTLDQKF